MTGFEPASSRLKVWSPIPFRRHRHYYCSVRDFYLPTTTKQSKYLVDESRRAVKTMNPVASLRYPAFCTLTPKSIGYREDHQFPLQTTFQCVPNGTWTRIQTLRGSYPCQLDDRNKARVYVILRRATNSRPTSDALVSKSLGGPLYTYCFLENVYIHFRGCRNGSSPPLLLTWWARQDLNPQPSD